MASALTRGLLWIGATSSLFVTAACSGDSSITVGRWCDEWFPGFKAEITIEDRGGGEILARLAFSDGSTEVQNLVESANLVYIVEDSEHGDRYRIIPATGELEVADNEGHLSIARPLATDPAVGDCF